MELCDFCGAKDVAWIYTADDFVATISVVDNDNDTIGEFHNIMTSPWAACDACSDDIEHDQWTEMAVRALPNAIDPHWHSEFQSQVKTSILLMHQEFKKSRTGSRIPAIFYVKV